MARRKRKVGMLDLESTIESLLKEYGDDVYEVLGDSVEKVANEATTKLKASNHFAPGGHPSGAYAGSWTHEPQPVNRLQVKETIYNEDHYRLTHLLENGHVIRNGTGRSFGKAPAYPHIKQVEEWTQEELPKEVKSRLGKL